jgi:hypothetical protein
LWLPDGIGLIADRHLPGTGTDTQYGKYQPGHNSAFWQHCYFHHTYNKAIPTNTAGIIQQNK